MATPGLGELIRAILKLDASIARQRDARQQVDVKIELSDQLRAAATPGAKVSVLGKFAGTGAFSGRESEVRRNLSSYRRHKQAYETMRASRDRLQQRIDMLRRRWAAMPGAMNRPGSASYLAAQKIKDRIRVTQQARRDALIAMRGHRRRATAAVGGAESAALSGGGGASIALSAARLSTAVTALTAAYKVGQAVIGAAEANLHRYGGYSLGGIRAQMTEGIGNFYRNIYISNKTSESMMEFAQANTRLKDSFADLNAGIIDLVNKLGTWIANTVSGDMERQNRAVGAEGWKAGDVANWVGGLLGIGPGVGALGALAEQTDIAKQGRAAKVDPELVRRRTEAVERLKRIQGQMEESEKEEGEARTFEERQRARQGIGIATPADVKDAQEQLKRAIQKRTDIHKDMIKIEQEIKEMDRKIADIAKKELDDRRKMQDEARKKLIDSQRKFFDQQIHDMPQFGRKAIDLDDPRAARMAADYLRRARTGNLAAMARGLWRAGGRNVNLRRMPGGAVRGGPLRRRPRVAGAGANVPFGRNRGGGDAGGAGGGGGGGGQRWGAPPPKEGVVPKAVQGAFAGVATQELRRRWKDELKVVQDAQAREKKALEAEDEAARKAGRNAPNDPVREAASEKRRLIQREIEEHKQRLLDIEAEIHRRRSATGRQPGVTWMEPTPSRRDPTRVA